MNNVHGGNLGKKRPNFGPNHVKNIKQLKPGMLICFRSTGDTKSPSPYEVIGIKHDNKKSFLKCKGFNGKTERSLADWGVIRYAWGIYKGLFNLSGRIEKFQVPNIYT